LDPPRNTGIVPWVPGIGKAASLSAIFGYLFLITPTIQACPIIIAVCSWPMTSCRLVSSTSAGALETALMKSAHAASPACDCGLDSPAAQALPFFVAIVPPASYTKDSAAY
jgi:hypothetical protein